MKRGQHTVDPSLVRGIYGRPITSGLSMAYYANDEILTPNVNLDGMGPSVEEGSQHLYDGVYQHVCCVVRFLIFLTESGETGQTFLHDGVKNVTIALLKSGDGNISISVSYSVRADSSYLTGLACSSRKFEDLGELDSHCSDIYDRFTDIKKGIFWFLKKDATYA